MNWFKRTMGLDFIDMAIQAVVTGLVMGFMDSTMPRADGPMMLVAGASIVVYAIRRHRALLKMGPEIGLTTGQMAAERIEELEARVAQLEGGEHRVAELEERLDFTERMLAQATGERASLPRSADA